MKLRKLEPIVKKTLENIPETRSDDFMLITYVYQQLGKIDDTQTFYKVMLGHKALELPSMESITRARRKIQEKFPHLINQETKRKRENREQEFIDYALGG